MFHGGMQSVDTKYFGTLPYREESVFDFPLGLPSFENEKRFVPIELPEHAPLLFLQSLNQPELCFLTFPILVVDGDYRLTMSCEDLAALELDPHRQPTLGSEVLVLALVSMHDGFSATANLMAPIVVNLKTRRALQAIREDATYSHQHPVALKAREEAC
jgi:flagellar assembly factor FliW